MKIFDSNGNPINLSTYDPGPIASRVLDAAAVRSGFERTRINFTPTVFDPNDFIPKKALVIDGEVVDYQHILEVRAPIDGDVQDADVDHLNDVVSLTAYLQERANG